MLRRQFLETDSCIGNAYAERFTGSGVANDIDVAGILVIFALKEIGMHGCGRRRSSAVLMSKHVSQISAGNDAVDGAATNS